MRTLVSPACWNSISWLINFKWTILFISINRKRREQTTEAATHCLKGFRRNARRLVVTFHHVSGSSKKEISWLENLWLYNEFGGKFIHGKFFVEGGLVNVSSGRLRGATLRSSPRRHGKLSTFSLCTCWTWQQTMEKWFQEHSETNEEPEAVISVSHVARIAFNHAVHIWQQNNL